MTPWQDCQEKVKFLTIEGCQFTFFGEVTVSSTAHEWTTLITLVSYKRNEAAEHGSSKRLIDQ